MRKTIAWMALALGVFGGAAGAHGAENAAGFYLLGSKGAMAGYVPPPGRYFSDLNYYYSGDAAGSAAVGRALRRLGNLTIEAEVELEGSAYINAPIVTWIAPGKVAGGNVGFGIMVPYGWKEVNVDLDVLATLTLPSGTTLQAGQRFALEDSSTRFGDPVLNALIGWHQGNWHWNISTLLNVPVGPWDTDSVSNLAFNHWALDTSAGVTWLDAARGHEVSVTAGFTFNWENPATDYRTGTEFHVEWALMQHLSKALSLGVGGYHYRQVSGDTGAGASVGSFEGRVSALGPVMTYGFALGRIPVRTELKWMHEFGAKNRLAGDAGLLTVSVPLSVPGR
jgi:hypothetical protein